MKEIIDTIIMQSQILNLDVKSIELGYRNRIMFLNDLDAKYIITTSGSGLKRSVNLKYMGVPIIESDKPFYLKINYE